MDTSERGSRAAQADEPTIELSAEELVAEHTGHVSVLDALRLHVQPGDLREMCVQLDLPSTTGRYYALLRLTIEKGVRAHRYKVQEARYRTIADAEAETLRDAIFMLVPDSYTYEDVDSVLAPWIAYVACHASALIEGV